MVLDDHGRGHDSLFFLFLGFFLFPASGPRPLLPSIFFSSYGENTLGAAGRAGYATPMSLWRGFVAALASDLPCAWGRGCETCCNRCCCCSQCRRRRRRRREYSHRCYRPRISLLSTSLRFLHFTSFSSLRFGSGARWRRWTDGWMGDMLFGMTRQRGAPRCRVELARPAIWIRLVSG